MTKEIQEQPDNDIRAESSEVDVTALASGTAVSLFGKIGGRGLFAVSQIILARFLGPELFGVYALGWSTLRLVGSLAPIGLDRGVIRFGTLYWRKNDGAFKDVLIKSLTYSLMAGLFLMITVFIIAPWLAEFFDEPELIRVLRIFAIAFPLLAGLRVLASASRITKSTKHAVYSEEIGQAVTNIILILIFIFLGIGLMGSVAATIGSFFIAFGLSIFFVLRLFPEIRNVKTSQSITTKTLLAFSIPTAFAGLFTVFTNWTDRLFLGYFESSAEVGVYQALAQSALLYVIILRAVNSIFSPMIADLHHKNFKTRLNELYKVATKWGLYLAIPLYLTICFAPDALLTVVFGPQYAVGALALVILATGQIINVATGSVGFLLVMTGRERHWMIVSGVTLGLNVILNLLLVPRLGLVGTAIASSATVSSLYIIGLFQVRWSLDLWPYDRRYAKGVIAALSATILLLIIKVTISFNTYIVELTVVASAATSVFFGLLILLGLDQEDRKLIDMARSRFQRKHA